MGNRIRKRSGAWVDVVATVCMVAALVTGLMLHVDVHHLHVYDDLWVWGIHEVAGFAIVALLIVHAVLHKSWIGNYRRIKSGTKWIVAIIDILFLLSCVTGIVLYMGSHSQVISRIHLISSVLFGVVALVHIIKEWKKFRGMMG